MQTNNIIWSFLKDNYFMVVLFLLSIFRIVPPEWAGFYKYNNNKESDGRAPRITVLRFVLNNIIDGILSSFLIPVLASFSLERTITLVIITIVALNILSAQQITIAAVSLVGIGITVLYLDKLIETGKHIEIFGTLLKWDKKEK